MNRKWWHDKTAYQIYPKSFLDTNNDGVGDLRGIIQKLDYLKSLGIGILWISPVFLSPFVDQGYDIEDYYKIDPLFGTMEDMDELLAKARERNIHVLMDLVVNHCSDRHELFRKALADPEGEYAGYFYFRDGKPDGSPPTNWRSYFGGSVWEKIPGTRNKYYLHMFAKEQPDLNWENPELRKRVYRMMNWWLDRGLSGFRVDAILNIKKDLLFRDFPADREDGLCSPMNMLGAASGIGDFLLEMQRETVRKRDGFTVGEAMGFADRDLPLFVGDEGYFSSIFDFSTELLDKDEKGWYHGRALSVDLVRDTLYDSQARMGDHGFFSNIVENHDEPRGADRYLPPAGRNDQGKKLLAVTMFMRRGLPFIYQGQEIGMTNYPFTDIDQFDDISTRNEYRVALDAGLDKEAALACARRRSRDNSRTPVQWNDGPNAGFSGGKPWLNVNPNYTKINVSSQEKDPDSVLNFYRALIALRTDPEFTDTVVYGAFEPFLKNISGLYAFFRRDPGADAPERPAPYGKGQPCAEGAVLPGSGRRDLAVLGNCSETSLTITLPEEGFRRILLNNYHELQCLGTQVTLLPFQAVILAREEQSPQADITTPTPQS